MNTFFYFEGRVYETEEAVIAATENYNIKKYDVVESNVEWAEFSVCYDYANNGVDELVAVLDAAKNGFQGIKDSLELVDDEYKQEMIDFLKENGAL